MYIPYKHQQTRATFRSHAYCWALFYAGPSRAKLLREFSTHPTNEPAWSQAAECRPCPTRCCMAQSSASLPADSRMSDITELIERARDGDRAAANEVFTSLYTELKRLARGQLRAADIGMRATSLVHEAYCKLNRSGRLAISDREHFYALAARVMRQIVLDTARNSGTVRRGGNLRIGGIDTQALRVAASEGVGDDLLALDEALRRLAEIEPDLERLVELRFFGGLELEEISALIGRSQRSLKRDWRRARAILYADLKGGQPDTPLAS